MEKNEKNEKPAWVAEVEKLPEIVRQSLGSTCVGVLTSLVQLALVSYDLYTAIVDEAYHIIHYERFERE